MRCLFLSLFQNSLPKQREQVSVALGLHFFIGDEAQSRTVDAVAHAVGRLRVAGEHMTEVGVSGAGREHAWSPARDAGMAW